MSVAKRFIKKNKELISRAIGVVRDLSSYLGPEDDWVEGLRKRVFVKLDPAFRKFGRPLIREKGEGDYIGVVEATDDEFEEVVLTKYDRNLTSTRKYRFVNGRWQWATGSFVYDPEDTEYQHHVFIFPEEVAEDGTVEEIAVYGHKEKSAEHDPYGHVTDKQEPGDPDGELDELFDSSPLSYVE